MIRYNAYRGSNAKPPAPVVPDRPLPTYGEIIRRVRLRQKQTGLSAKEILMLIGLRQQTFYAWAQRPNARPTQADGIANLRRLDELTYRWQA